MIINLEPSNHIIRRLVDEFRSIGKKTYSKYQNTTHRVLTQEIVKMNTRNHHLFKPTYNVINFSMSKTFESILLEENILTQLDKKLFGVGILPISVIGAKGPIVE
jgi:hypothetical protein